MKMSSSTTSKNKLTIIYLWIKKDSYSKKQKGYRNKKGTNEQD